MASSLRRTLKKVITRVLPAKHIVRVVDWRYRRRMRRDFGAHAISSQAGHSAAELTLGNLDAVCAALSRSGVAYYLMPRVTVFRPIVVIDAADLAEAARALSELPSGSGWNVRVGDASSRPTTNLRVKGRTLGRSSQIAVWRHVTAGTRTLSSSFETVQILAWDEVPEGTPRVDGGEFARGTLHRRAAHPVTTYAYLEPDDMQFLADREEELRRGGSLDGRSMMESVDGPIDAVYTWVDGDDPVWLASKANTLGRDLLEQVNETADSHSRYASRDELKYSLRSLEMYAPWVRNIYIVTAGQRPLWLDADHPRIHLVDHRDIFADASALPVFNSHAIESQLHRIPGLSERYVYLNDDVFFGRPVPASTFFSPGGLSKYFPSKAVLAAGVPSARDMPVLSAAKHNRSLIENHFGRIVSHKFKHTPHPQLRSVIEDMERSMPEIFESVARSRVRHPSDVSISSALHHFWGVATGRSVEGRIRYDYVDLAQAGTPVRLATLSARTDLDVFCLNDTHLPLERAQEVDRVTRTLLDQRFPVQSSFELR